MSAIMTKTPGGEEIVILSRAEYDALTAAKEDIDDAATARAIRARLDAETEEVLTSEEMKALLAAPTPLAFWRKKRGLSQIDLAREVGVVQGYVPEMENGRRTGDVVVLVRIARALNVKIDDLVTG
ncbi:helix-turn-helix domain-containing protein [Labrys wisconsinensis]|uniref:DNA-binding XRE family transcriptional regulator n=1 Tax=Labrys wisconsinensis TaxID=425677 RepID=A0ABU0JF78_9HYPH|nr:helix-turn-helix transcriptional regulator [Labrys wisconsinensis]MDQ0472938.1 DNA-binding XRE family transcriptional regulator [Labrys wisconsinensis]